MAVATVAAVLVDAFERVREAVHEAVVGLDPAELAFRADPAANSIGWLVWHLTRIEDDHLADAGRTEQVWTAGGWVGRFSLPFGPAATGYRHGPDDVAAVQVPSGALLTGYHDAVHDQAVRYVGGLQDADLDRVVDVRWDPPVTLGVRLVSVLADALQHAGQAAFVRGIVERRRS